MRADVRMNQKQQSKTIRNSAVKGPISDIPYEERPYEKCLACGAESLSDAELLAVILRTGIRGESVLDLSRRILSMHNGQNGLLAFHHASVEELTSIRGVGTVKAVQLKCIAELSLRFARKQAEASLAFSDASAIAAYYMEQMRHYEQERMLLLSLDARCRLIREETVSMGTVRAAVITPREIFISALRARAVSIILLHNHPSGSCEPSGEDLVLTERIRLAGKMIGISLLDHIIIGDRRFYSMLEMGDISRQDETETVCGSAAAD